MAFNSTTPTWEKNLPTLSKVKLGNTLYYLKDAEGREELTDLIASLGTLAYASIASGEQVLKISSDGKSLSSTLSIAYDSESRKVQLKGIEGAVISDFDASAFIKDGMLWGEKAFVASGTTETVSITKGDVTQTHEFTGLTKGHQYLAFCFTDGAVPTPAYSWEIVDLQDLVDVYTAGDGLELDDHKFAVKIDEDSEDFLTVSGAGVKLDGVGAAITSEETRAKAAEQANAAAITAEETRATGKEAELAAATATVAANLAAEAQTARAAEQANATAIQNEVTRATAAELANAARIDAADEAIEAEVTRATTAELANADAISAEKTRAEGVEGQLATDLAAEIERAIAEEGKLWAQTTVNATAISAEETRALEREDELAGDISEEVNRATEAEEALNLAISTINGDIAALEGRMTTAESDIDALETSVSALSTSLTQEIADRKAADNVITATVSAIDTRLTTAESDIDALEADKVDRTQTIAGVDLQDDITKAELQTALGLEDLAYADTASGTVAGQTISGVKATGNLSGTVAVSIADFTPTTASIDYENYTPAGAVTGSVVAEGTISKPSVDVTVSTISVRVADNEGTGYTMTDGSVNKADDTTGKFVKKAFNFTVGTTTVDSETLFIEEVTSTDTTFFSDAVVAAGAVTYTAPVLTGALPTFKDATVANSASAALAAAPEFTGSSVSISAEFAGTAAAIKASTVTYDKAQSATGNATITGAELNVGDIVVAAKTVTVTPDTVTP